MQDKKRPYLSFLPSFARRKASQREDPDQSDQSLFSSPSSFFWPPLREKGDFPRIFSSFPPPSSFTECRRNVMTNFPFPFPSLGERKRLSLH